MGHTVIDADKIARDIVAPGEPALNSIRTQFGQQVVDSNGNLDRRALGRIVFADPAARRTLEAITHPAIFQRTHEILSTLRDQMPKEALVFYENALLYETKSDAICDKIVAVTTPDSIQMDRLRIRDPDLSEKECEERIASQLPTAEKAARADYIISNDGSFDALEHSVKQCLQCLHKDSNG